MIGEHTADGREIRLRSQGPGRFFSAAFLALWLCGWAAGECFAFWMLFKGGMALLTGTAPDPGHAPLQMAPALMGGAFLLVWLAFWTLGGIAALHELLRLLWGEDRLTALGSQLTVVHSRGIFRSVKRYQRDAIRRISLLRHGRLVLESGHERIELSALGSQVERAEAAAALAVDLGLPTSPIESAPAIPAAWQEIVTPEGERAVVKDLSTRTVQARVAGVIVLALAGLTFLFAREAVGDPKWIAPAVFVSVLTVGAIAGHQWLTRGRWEWRIGSGRLTLRRRFDANVRDVFEARRLMLDCTTDSDGDPWYELFALADAGPAPEPASSGWRPGRVKNSRSIARLMNDDFTVRNLGAWLAREAGIELDDRTRPDARKLELAQIRDLLEKSGPLGRWAAKVVDKLGDRRQEGPS